MHAKQQEAVAREAIGLLYGTTQGEFGPTLFVSHHLNELGPDYWKETCGTESPTALHVLQSLILIDSWNSKEDDSLDVFDFSLPNEVSDYVLSARFVGGEIVEVSMES